MRVVNYLINWFDVFWLELCLVCLLFQNRLTMRKKSKLSHSTGRGAVILVQKQLIGCTLRKWTEFWEWTHSPWHIYRKMASFMLKDPDWPHTEIYQIPNSSPRLSYKDAILDLVSDLNKLYLLLVVDCFERFNIAVRF